MVLEDILVELIVGVILLIVGAAVGPRALQNLWRRIKARDQSPAEGGRFTILVADLANDSDRSQTRHVINALEDQFGGDTGIQVRGFTRRLDVDPWDDQASARAVAERRGQEWLHAQNADVLIWGAVVAADRSLRLRFVTRAEGGVAVGNYTLTERIQLPADFGQDLPLYFLPWRSLLRGQSSIGLATRFRRR